MYNNVLPPKGYYRLHRAGFYTFQTSDTFVGMRYFCVFVPKKTHFAQHFLRTSVNAFPASLASMMIHPNGRQTKVAVKNFIDHII
jgi:hypothetical protein